MKKVMMIVTALMIAFATPAMAAGQTAFVDVNGLVCDFCAQAINKVFTKQPEVEKVDVNLDTKVITIEFKDGQKMAEEKIKSLIQDSGYDVVKVRYTEAK